VAPCDRLRVTIFLCEDNWWASTPATRLVPQPVQVKEAARRQQEWCKDCVWASASVTLQPTAYRTLSRIVGTLTQ